MTNSSSNNSKLAAWVAVGSLFSFIVGIVSPMILSRFFDKSDYGTYKQVMYVYNTLLAVFTLGLPKAYAYFLPKYTYDYSHDIISKITKIFFILGLIFSLFLLIGAGQIASIMNNPDLKYALIVFSPTPFLLLPTMGLDAIYASFRKTKYLAYYTIFTRILTITFIIIPVIFFSGNYIHAIIGFDIASLITFFLALYLKSWPIKNECHKKSDLTYKRILNFSLPLLYASLWGIIISSATQFFISRYYGNEIFADFSNGFMELPFVGMILGSISAILLPVISGMDKGNGLNQDALKIWHSALLKSAKILFPILIFSTFFAKSLMTCMYGDMYAQSSIYFIIKNISGLSHIIPVFPIILAIGKTKTYANVHMLIAFTIIVAEYIVCNIFNSAIYVAITSELCQFLKVWIMMQVIAEYTQKRIIDLMPPKPMIKLILISTLACLPPFIFTHIIEMNKFITLFICLGIFLIDYYILCWIYKITYRDIVGGFIKNKTRLTPILKILP